MGVSLVLRGRKPATEAKLSPDYTVVEATGKPLIFYYQYKGKTDKHSSAGE